ncbi:lipoyl domain-containing protein [Sphingosinicellaceae bacterium]|nr:lipoyl domain-containing protein [Sphingosinicellaceae bacterium]
MSTELRIPKLGMTMTEATLQEWLVPDGATVTAGQPIYALETDKSTTEVESPDAGTLRHLGTPDETYDVGTLIGTIE